MLKTVTRRNAEEDGKMVEKKDEKFLTDDAIEKDSGGDGA